MDALKIKNEFLNEIEKEYFKYGKLEDKTYSIMKYVSKEELPLKEIEELVEKGTASVWARPMYINAYKLSFNLETMEFVAEDNAIGEILFYAKGNTPYVRLSLKKEYTRFRGTTKALNTLFKKHVGNHKYEMSFAIWDNISYNLSISKAYEDKEYDEDFMSLDPSKIRIKAEIDLFYEAGNHYFVKPNKAVVNRLEREGYPLLAIRHINKDGFANCWGLRNFVWRNIIVYEDGYIEADELTEDIVNTFYANHNRVKETFELQKKLNSPESKKAYEDILEINSKMQKVIDTNEKDILLNCLELFNVKEEKDCDVETLKRRLLSLEKPILDCGFVHFMYPSELKKVAELATMYKDADKPLYSRTYANLRTPILCQGLTIMEPLAKICARYIKEELGYNVWIKSELD